MKNVHEKNKYYLQKSGGDLQEEREWNGGQRIHRSVYLSCNVIVH